MTTHSPLFFSKNQEKILNELINASLTPKAIATRASIILLYAQGKPHTQICEILNISYAPIYKWSQRWQKAKPLLDQMEMENKSSLKSTIIDVLKDSPRSGAPPKFKEEQIMQIIALACTSPQNEGLPVSQWSCRLLAEHVKQLGIAKSISYKQINNFLKSRSVKTS